MMSSAGPGRVILGIGVVVVGLAAPAAAIAPDQAGDGAPEVRAGAAIRAAETSLGLGATAELFWGGGNAAGTAGGVVRAGRLGPVAGVPDLYTALTYDVAGRGAGPVAGGTGLVNRVEVRLGAGFAPGGDVFSGRSMVIPFLAGGYEAWSGPAQGLARSGVYHAALAGGGVRFDLAVSDALVVSASAAGFAVLGGRLAADGPGAAATFGVSGEAAVRLGADLRLEGRWRAFAGVGLSYRQRPAIVADAPAGLVPVSTTQFQSIVGVAYGFR